MSTDAEATALKALLTAETKAPALDLDEIRELAAAPATYTEVYLSRRAGGQYRLDGTRSTDLRRLSTRVVSRSVTNGRLVEDRIAAAFQYATITIDGSPIHVEYESGGGDFDHDDGYYTALTDWIFGL